MIFNNTIAETLRKSPAAFTKADIIGFIEQSKSIRHVNFMYPAGDGRLKTLNFIINDKEYLDEFLTCGERVDGSSLFPFIEASSSDLYVIPRYQTAFLDPFSELPTLTMLASFVDKDGNPLESSPEYTLQKACHAFREATGGMEFEAMGELEFYVIGEDDGTSFPAMDQHGYHESTPYAKFSAFRQLCLQYIAQVGGRIKYGHCEVGNFALEGKVYEQHEIEFLPVPAEKAADQLILAKWVIRNLAHQRGLNVTFAPKITVGRAGSGMHVHMRVMKDGKNQMLDEHGEISELARKFIAGMITLAPSLTAFGNTIPTSYFRLVPNQEAPTKICWGERNRSALVRVPLGWAGSHILDKVARINPSEEGKQSTYNVSQKQTVEIRSPDGSANLYLLLAGLAVACRIGFEMENALEVADRTRVNVNIHNPQNAHVLKNLKSLPASCAASADCLDVQRKLYEDRGVFSSAMIDGIQAELRAFGDDKLREEIDKHPEKVAELTTKYFHCG